MGAEALRYAGTKASEGYPPVAKSAEAVIPGSGLAPTPLTHSSTGRARGLLRRRIKIQNDQAFKLTTFVIKIPIPERKGQSKIEA